MSNQRLYPVRGDDPRLIGSQATSFTQLDFFNKADAVSQFTRTSGSGTVSYNAAGPSVIGTGCFQFSGTGTWITNALFPVSVDSGVKGTCHYATTSNATVSIGFLSYNSALSVIAVSPAQNYFLLNGANISNASLIQASGTVRGEGISNSNIPTGTRYIQPVINITANSSVVYIDAFILTHFLDNSIPAGVINSFAGTTAPQGYLLCDGSQVSRTTYSSLYSAIGNAYGAGNGSSTFHLPDLRGRFLRGVDGVAGRDPDSASRIASNAGGNTGNNLGSAQLDQFFQHNHYIRTVQTTSLNGTYPWGTQDAGSIGGQDTGNAGGNETRPKNVYVNYIIKY